MTLLSTGTTKKLVSEHFPRIHSRLRGLVRNDELASDLAQDTFLQAFRDLPRAGEIERFGAWLMTIAWRTWRAWLRSAAGQTERMSTSTAPEVLARIPGEAEDPTAQSAERSSVWSAVDRVPEPYRTTLIQRYREDRTVPEIAAAQGIGLSLAKFRLRRGEQLARAFIAPRGR